MNVLDIILNFVVKICEPLSQYEYKSFGNVFRVKSILFNHKS